MVASASQSSVGSLPDKASVVGKISNEGTSVVSMGIMKTRIKLIWGGLSENIHDWEVDPNRDIFSEIHFAGDSNIVVDFLEYLLNG